MTSQSSFRVPTKYNGQTFITHRQMVITTDYTYIDGNTNFRRWS